MMSLRKFIKSIKATDQYKRIKLLAKNIRSSKFGRYFPTRVIRKFLVKEVKKFFFRRKLKKNVPVFVFQMGKVGSRSIADSLKSSYPGIVVHRHTIYEDDWESQYLLDWVKKGKPLKIISPVRDPIGRNISAFFHFIEGRFGHASDKSMLPVSELVDIFVSDSDPDERPENKWMMEHDMPLKWFDENVKKYFDIDVYSSPFPESGSQSYSHENVDLLVLRIDVKDEEKERVIRDFLNYQDFKLENRNIGSSKNYAGKYKEFKEHAVLPEWYLQDMCESKFFKHFYTAEEISRIRGKWLSR
jgi:hypothetical protein